MNSEIEAKELSVVVDSTQIDVDITQKAKFDVVVGEVAKIDVGQAINYIKSGENEIKATVVSGVEVFNSNAADKTLSFNQNATDKTAAFNSNATDKITDFNDNASDKTLNFNENAAAKQANVDASAALAKQYAIGEPTEPLGNSAKYWAEQASSELSGLTSRVSSIEGKIPSTATGNNQLTDKSYVDTADTALQTQIDALSAASDVSDIVGTYAELQAYDTSTLQNNNIIKVLQNETHNNETTYYRWVITGGVGAWVLIGEEGPYYTIAAADAAFQEKLVSGTNIKTVNGNSLVGSGNVDIDALPNQTGQGGKFLTTNGTTASWAEANVTPDNKSISKNTANALQSIGIIDQNNPANALGVWHGTQAEYDALATHDANTRYYTDGGLSVSLLDVIYPIGSIYITTNSSCPLQALGVGTWELVGQDRVLQGAGLRGAVGTTLSAGLPNIIATVRGTNRTDTGETTNGFKDFSGSFYATETIAHNVCATASGNYQTNGLGFNAALSNPIYGNSATVQPDAYLVNIFRRIS
ncbi:MAG: hypothetical protein IKK52_02650 [Alphaproteobacteria bacterium]|nr:hypothetical protein [Alphaproteobacteria bacterium]